MHHLLGLHLVDSSRMVVTMDCRPEAEQGQRFRAQEGADVAEERTILLKYKSRPRNAKLDRISYFRWATLYNHKDHTLRPRARPAVLSYFSKYTQGTKDFARVKMMLHYPFHKVSNVLNFDGNAYATYLEAYEACKAACEYNDFNYYAAKVVPTKDTDEFKDRINPPNVEAGT